MFQEFHTKKGISQVVEGAEWYDMSGDAEYHIDEVQGDRCGKCGSRKHSSDSCQVDFFCAHAVRAQSSDSHKNVLSLIGYSHMLENR